jgi:hypothetical protein
VTEDRMPENRMASFRANNQRAIAALEAVATYAHTRPAQTSALPAGTGPERDHDRLSRVLCGVRHLADQFYGLRFHQIRTTADGLYRRTRTTAVPGSLAETAAAAAAIDIYELVTPAQMRRPGSIWPLDTLAEFDSYATSHGIPREAAVARLTSGLVASLRHYADHQGLDFSSAMTAGIRAHAQQRLNAYGPIDTGLTPDRRPAMVLSPSAAAPPFEPVVTHQGVVTALGDAEWLLIRTAARIGHGEQHGYLTSDRDLDDRRALADALARACSLPETDILGQLTPKIAARVTEIERGPAEAAQLGREHGRAGIEPYCDLDIDGDATALLSALGETEWMTDANHGYRVSLVIAYADAYKQASRNGPPAADSPARIAARDFPPQHLPSPQAGAPASPDAASPARATPRPGPGHRPRRRT